MVRGVGREVAALWSRSCVVYGNKNGHARGKDTPVPWDSGPHAHWGRGGASSTYPSTLLPRDATASSVGSIRTAGGSTVVGGELGTVFDVKIKHARTQAADLMNIL